MRTVTVRVYEEIVERKTIEVEVADDVDLDDHDTRQHVLEDAYIEGAYKLVEGTSDLQVRERDFTVVQS